MRRHGYGPKCAAALKPSVSGLPRLPRFPPAASSSPTPYRLQRLKRPPPSS